MNWRGVWHWLVIGLLLSPTLAVLGLWIASTATRLNVVPNNSFEGYIYGRFCFHWTVQEGHQSDVVHVDRRQYLFDQVQIVDCSDMIDPPAHQERTVRVAVSIPLLLTMPLLWLAFRRWRRQWTRDLRNMAGECVRCGYDLRMTPDRCPECGWVPTQVAARPG